MSLFKKESLERISSLAHLENAVTVVGIKGWLVLSFFIILTLSTILWSILGTIPITAGGKCIIFDPSSVINISSPATARVKKINAVIGSQVKKGDIVIVLEDPLLEQKVIEQKSVVAFLQNEIDKMVSPSDIEDKKLQLLTERNRLTDLEVALQNLQISSPIDATVSWIGVNEGSRVTPDLRLISLQGGYSPSTLKVFGFMSLYEGQQIKPGMEVKVDLDTVNAAKYGMICATVEQVLTYPTDLDGYYSQKIPSQALREFLIQGPLPTILVIIKPILDDKTESGFAWSSKKGAPIHIEPGIIGSFRVTLNSVKPISYILPSIFSKE